MSVSYQAGSYRSAGADQQFSLGFELGERMRETVHINLGLLALKKCVEALNNRAPYVPYMDSKLTMVSCWPSLVRPSPFDYRCPCVTYCSC